MLHAFYARAAHIMLLLKRSSVIERIDAQATSGDRKGCTALSLAVATEHGTPADRAGIDEWLFEKGADPCPSLSSGKSILHGVGDIEVLSLLLEAGSNATATDNEGWTPLMQHALRANAAHVWLLLQYPPVVQSINARATGGLLIGATALSLAVKTSGGIARNEP